MKPIDKGRGIHGHIGISGSGKSYKCKAAQWVSMRADPSLQAVVLDIPRELYTVPRFLRAHTATFRDVAGATAWLRGDKRRRLAIVRGRRTADEWREQASQAAAWAMDTGNGLAIYEAHFAVPNKTDLSAEMLELITAWRRSRVPGQRDAVLWWDSQRLALVSRTLTAQSITLSIFTIVDDVDLNVVRQLGRSTLLLDAIAKCAAKLEKGEPGWHVELGYVRTPPYAIQRTDESGKVVQSERP